MIFKIIMDFSNMLDILQILQKNFDVLYMDGKMFIATKGVKEYTVMDIKKMICDNNVCVLEINENNIDRENDRVSSWCKDKFLKNDLIRYENENQDKLKEINKILDEFDNNLLNIIKRKEGNKNG